MEKLVLSIPEAAQAVSLSPWTIRKWIAQGKLRVIRLGRRVCISPDALRELVKKGEACAEGRKSVRLSKKPTDNFL